MKVQRLFTLMVAFLTLSTATVAASSIWGDYEGYSKARVMVNGTERYFSSSDVPGFIINGKTVLPLRDLAESLQTMVKWNDPDKTALLYRPNVHLSVVRDIGKDYSMKEPFGVVTQGKTIDFVVFAQVDNLQTGISSIRITIESPSGNNVVTPHEKGMYGQKDSFWYPVRFTDVSFNEHGKYKVKFAMKPDESSDYTVVSEKEIYAE
jgi:hypothetical protein